MSEGGSVDTVEGRRVKPMHQQWVSGGKEPPLESSRRRHTRMLARQQLEEERPRITVEWHI
jgi:hypothetical protein